MLDCSIAEEARDLVDEVVEFVVAGRMLGAHHPTPPASPFSLGDKTFFRKCMSRSSHLHDLRRGSDCSFYMTLFHLCSDIDSWFCGVDSWSSYSFSDLECDALDKITLALNRDERLASLAKGLYGNRKSASGRLTGAILWHLGSVLHARLLTLSKRHALTELIFQTYRDGYYPTGWNLAENTMYCLDLSEAE